MRHAACVGISQLDAHANVAGAAWPARTVEDEGVADEEFVVAAHGFGMETVRWIFYAPVGATFGRVVGGVNYEAIVRTT